MQEVLFEILVPIQLVKEKSESDGKVVRTDFIQGLLHERTRDCSLELGSILKTARTSGYL